MQIFLFFIIFFLFFSKSSIAVPVSTPSAGVQNEKLEKIRELKEKVARKVSQLRQEKKLVLMGEIKRLEDDGFVLMTNDGEKTVRTKKETKYYWINTNGKQLVITFDNFEKGDFVAVNGEKDVDDSILAKIVVGKLPSFFLTGVVTKVIQDGETLVVSFKEKGVSMSAVVSRNAKISLFDEKLNINLGRFTDIARGIKFMGYGSYKGDDKEKILVRYFLILSKPSNTSTISPP